MHTDNDKIWREKADEIKVDPTTNTWSRVRSKLDGSKKQEFSSLGNYGYRSQFTSDVDGLVSVF